MMIFDEVFETGIVPEELKSNELLALATGLSGWACCMGGGNPPEKFGVGMAALGTYLACPATPEEMSKRVDILQGTQ